MPIVTSPTIREIGRDVCRAGERGLTMITIARAITTLSLALFAILLVPADAEALCLTSADCPAGRICRAGFLGIPVCREIACNFDRDCPANQRPCAGGACRFPPTGGGGGGAGVPVSGEGAACGRVQMGGGVVKSIGALGV